MYRESALPYFSQSSPRLSGNGNHEPKKVGPTTGSQRMLPPAVSMYIPAWPRPVMRMDSSPGQQSRSSNSYRVYGARREGTGGRAGEKAPDNAWGVRIRGSAPQ